MQEEDSAAPGNVEKEHFLSLTCHNFACGSGDQRQEGLINIRSLEPFPGEARMSRWAVWGLSGPREAVSWDVCGLERCSQIPPWLQNLLTLNFVIWVYHQGNFHALNSYYLFWKQMLNCGLENRTWMEARKSKHSWTCEIRCQTLPLKQDTVFYLSFFIL